MAQRSGPEEAPGLAPRAMQAIFQLMEEQKSTLKVEVSCYMMEMYLEVPPPPSLTVTLHSNPNPLSLAGHLRPLFLW